MFSIIPTNKVQVEVKKFDSEKEEPFVIEGAKVFHQLMPVSKLTGQPASLHRALKQAVNDPSLSSLVNQVILELPAIRSDSRLTDEDRLDLVIDRFSVGTPAENAAVAERLSAISDVLFPVKAPDPASVEPAPVESAPAAE